MHSLTFIIFFFSVSLTSCSEVSMSIDLLKYNLTSEERLQSLAD